MAVVPAAGLSTRFVGGDKLLADYRGMPLAAHIAETLADMEVTPRIAICPSGDSARADLFATRGFEIVWNEAPRDGLGRSLALGAARAQGLGAAGMLVCLADMPNVSREHLERLLAAADAARIVATEVHGVRMPPALFPREALPRLLSLEGDRGAKAMLADAATVVADAILAHDVDRQSDLDVVSPMFRGREEASRG